MVTTAVAPVAFIVSKTKLSHGKPIDMTQKSSKRLFPWITIAVVVITVTVAIADITLLPFAPSVLATMPTQAKQSNEPRLDPAVAKATVAKLLAGVDKTPEQPVVRRTVVAGKYALATWRWGEAGGQALLVKQQGRWQVISEGGGALDLATLQQNGVPANIARTLLQREQAAQQR